MKKAILVAFALGLLFVGSEKVQSQNSEFQTRVLSGTADVLIDSTLDSLSMNGRRIYINGIYAWWDNGANTNQIFVEVVRGRTNLATQGAGRQFKYSEAMTSGGIKGVTFIPNITTGRDSTIYFVISAASSDSLFLAINYKLVN